jgi:hypothetical protein
VPSLPAELPLPPFRRLLLLALCLPASVTAQGTGADSAPAPIISGIVIDRRDIFDSSETHNWFMRTANSLHFTTRPWVIRREMLFKVGEPYDSAKVSETARNLRALRIFREVSIDTVTTDSGLVVHAVTQDGWTTRLDVTYRSTGGQVVYGGEIAETNLLGTNTTAIVKYRKDTDRSSVLGGFNRPRLFHGSIGVAASYEHRSDGHQGYFSVARPLFSLADRAGGGLQAQLFDGRVLRFRNGGSVATDTLTRRFNVLVGEGALALRAGSTGYLRLGMVAQIQRDDFQPEALTSPLSTSLSGAAGLFLESRRARYLVTRGFQSFERNEDVDLSTIVRVTALAAPRAFGYPRDGIGGAASVGFGTQVPSGFASFRAGADGLFTSAGLDSGSVLVGATFAFKGGTRHLLVLHGSGGQQRNPAPGQEFDLGLGFALRAFPAHAFTGDRYFLTTAEYRWMAFPSVFRVLAIGIAGYGDYAGAWYAGSSQRTGADAGLGLRIGPIRTADGQAMRIDLTRQFANDVMRARWVLVIGKGFVFQNLE